jgi:putative restriction endonuclease
VDPNNGLLLAATLDALFDRGLVSFEQNGNMIVSPKLHYDARLILLPHKRNLIREASERQQEYLAWHRREVLRG